MSIAINRSKRGPASDKAFLTTEGKGIVQNRRQDFEFVFLMKKSDSYIFTSDPNHDHMLRGESAVNKVIHGQINQTVLDPNSIMERSKGDIKVESTSLYLETLSDEERQPGMLQPLLMILILFYNNWILKLEICSNKQSKTVFFFFALLSQ